MGRNEKANRRRAKDASSDHSLRSRAALHFARRQLIQRRH